VEEREEKVRIAQVSCGTIYGHVQHEIERAVEEIGAEIFVPEVDLDKITACYVSILRKDTSRRIAYEIGSADYNSETEMDTGEKGAGGAYCGY
jgi:activator of 2-hydroxyglutaryl-CoA dehydratase